MRGRTGARYRLRLRSDFGRTRCSRGAVGEGRRRGYFPANAGCSARAFRAGRPSAPGFPAARCPKRRIGPGDIRCRLLALRRDVFQRPHRGFRQYPRCLETRWTHELYLLASISGKSVDAGADGGSAAASTADAACRPAGPRTVRVRRPQPRAFDFTRCRVWPRKYRPLRSAHRRFGHRADVEAHIQGRPLGGCAARKTRIGQMPPPPPSGTRFPPMPPPRACSCPPRYGSSGLRTGCVDFTRRGWSPPRIPRC